MKRFLAALLCLGCLSLAASAAPGPQSYTTSPIGTILGNPDLYQPGGAVPHALAYGNIGHIAILKAADMTKTTDQPLIMLDYNMPSNYLITSIYATCPTDPTGAVGGIYTGVNKSGTQIVAAAQTYTTAAITPALESLTNNVAVSIQSSSQLYLSLTTAAASGTPTCDIYVDGIGLE
jgi:hypothetical protein